MSVGLRRLAAVLRDRISVYLVDFTDLLGGDLPGLGGAARFGRTAILYSINIIQQQAVVVKVPGTLQHFTAAYR